MKSLGLSVLLMVSLSQINQPDIRVRKSELAECRRLAPKYGIKDPKYIEYRLWDGTRVDLLTATHAIEVDWAPKWAEGIGQALYYAQLTGKKPAVLLLISDMRKEKQFVYRLQTVAAKYDITVYLEKVVDKKDLQVKGQ